jgi:3',5'-cyclic AMP phosphodiesterase CpdA
VNLWAISDLHVGYEENRQAVAALEPMPDDWLIIAGDTGETPTHLDFVLKALVPRFAQIVWTVGNHDLWTPHSLPPERRGVAHYERLVRLCRSYGVLTPEDPFAVWPGDGPRTAIVPTFGLYDYTFRPASVPADDAVAWAAAAGVRCADEDLLSPSPFGSRQEWCAARVGHTEQRLEMLPQDTRVILVNHWPLLHEHGVPHPAFFDLVRDRGDGRLASSLSRRHRRVRSPAYAQHAGARRRDLRGGFARLPAAVERGASAA